MKRYDLGTTNEVAEDYDGEQFYTVADAVANADWDCVRQLARLGDPDAQAALDDAGTDTQAEWGEWQEIGDQEGTRQRYIEAITLDGVRYTGEGDDMVAPDGRVLRRCGRGEIQTPGHPVVTVYATDGIPVCEDTERQPDAEDDCEEAIREALEDD